MGLEYPMNEHEIERIACALHTLPGEKWRAVPGYERTYAVSNLGRVYSAPRPTTSGGILNGSVDNYGYRRVALVQNGKQATRRVHVLVMAAFVGPRPDGLEILHSDGDKQNCRLENLSYGTHAENMRDMVRHGGTSQTRKTHCPQGHEYAGVNLLVSGGRRYCRTCHGWKGAA